MAGALRTVANSAHVGVGENHVLMEVDQLSGLVDEGRRETVGVGLVVDQLGIDVVVDVPLLEGARSDYDSGASVAKGNSQCFPKLWDDRRCNL